MDAELLILPYDSANGVSLFHRLIHELDSGDWRRFRAAVAFARDSGNAEELLTSMVDFVSNGGVISLTFGADTFGSDSGTDLQAIKQLLDRLSPFPTVELYLYHESGRTFHPKIYLFDNEQNQIALLVLGSSNWSFGGLADNVEANLILRLQLDVKGERTIYDRLVYCFENYWREP